MDDKSSVAFIQHDLSFAEQQEFSITCSFGIDVRVPGVIKAHSISVASLWDIVFISMELAENRNFSGSLPAPHPTPPPAGACSFLSLRVSLILRLNPGFLLGCLSYEAFMSAQSI